MAAGVLPLHAPARIRSAGATTKARLRGLKNLCVGADDLPMAAQRAPQDPRESQSARRSLRLVHSTDAPAEAAAAPSAFRGLLWALVLSVVGFWAPVGAIVAYLIAR